MLSAKYNQNDKVKENDERKKLAHIGERRLRIGFLWESQKERGFTYS
jgi:hypothetical protein